MIQRLLLCLFALLSACAHAQQLRAEHVAVIYNTQSAHSVSCAKLYAEQRQIPARNLLGLSIDPKLHDISHAQYENLVARPLLSLVKKHQLILPSRLNARTGQAIYAAVLMPDLPIRIQPTPPPAGQKAKDWRYTQAASVDSELAFLGVQKYPKEGMLRNPAYLQNEHLALSGFRVLIATRIESSNEMAERRMILVPPQIEKRGGLKGAWLVDSGGPYPAGDSWFLDVALAALDKGYPLYLDRLKETLPEGFPVDKQTVVYAGWYAGNANGPFSPKSSFRFADGAIAFHLHSFSATHPSAVASGWVAALTAKGADVTAGNVWEPFLAGSLRPDTFFYRLLAGYSVAEAAAMATPSFSWQGIILGDPLYRPFPQGKPIAARNPSRKQKATRALIKGKYADAASIYYGLLKEKPSPRVVIGAAQAFLLNKETKKAQNLLQGLIKLNPNSPQKPAWEQMLRNYPTS